MSHRTFTVHVSERGRFVVPAALRKSLELDAGDLLVVEEHEDRFVVRKAVDVAQGFRGYLRKFAPDRDLAAELMAERREEGERETGLRDSLDATRR